MLQFLKRKQLSLVVVFTVILLVTAISMSMALETSAPGIDAQAPGEGITVDTAGMTVSFHAYDLDSIANSNYYIKVNGTTLKTALEYQGHLETDSCGSSYWVVDSYGQATIAGKVSGLQDGPQTVEAKVVDRLGNPALKSWTFNVAVKPTFSQLTPANGSTAVVNNLLSAKVTDNTQVDPASIKLAVDNNPVDPANLSFDSSTGLLNYIVPAPGLANGTHTAVLSAKDKAGNEAGTSWSFNVQAVGEPLTFADSGKTLITAAPELKVTAIANARLDSAGAVMSLDGKPLAATFTYKGHWDYPFELDPVWVIDSYNEATISGAPAGLTDGAHTLAVTAKDIYGNQVSGQWPFTVKASPIFTNPAPANGQNTAANQGFSVKVMDNDSIVPDFIAVSLDGVPIPALFDAATGTISYQPAGGLGNGPHTVKASAQDTTGNLSTFTWSFTVQASGPQITFASAGQTFDTAQPVLSVAVKSNVKVIDTSVGMIIDGQPVQAAFTYKGHTEYPFELDPYWAIDSYNEGTLENSPLQLNDGTHEMIITARDSLGNQSTQTFQFSVAQKPVFGELAPVAGTTVGTRTPQIKAVINDPNGTIDKASVKLLLDNLQVTPTITDNETGITAAFTTGSLTIDTFHTVNLTAADNSGNINSATWKFYVNTKGDMPIGAKDCGSCHRLNQYDKYVHSEGPLGITVQNPGPTHFYGSACNHCHSGYSEKTCGYCHGADIFPPYDDPTWVRPTPNPALSAGQDCLYCHSTNNGGWVPSEYPAYHFYWVKNLINTGLDPIKPLYPDLEYTVRHDILPTHKIEKATCNDCHSIYLTREHNRKNKDGVQITCATCHSSTDPKVQQAISTKNLDCLACHTQADHEAVHNDGMDANCQTCHSAALTSEHLNNQTTTAGKNLTCDTCHASADKRVQRSVAAGNVGCGACHSTGHNIPLAPQVPKDLPLYSEFVWSTPIEADIYTNETPAVNEYAGGQVVVSNRVSGITADTLWGFYSEQFTAKGWTLKSGAPEPGAPYFSAVFTKASRQVTVKCFNTENSDGLGSPLASGYRLEIWYK